MELRVYLFSYFRTIFYLLIYFKLTQFQFLNVIIYNNYLNATMVLITKHLRIYSSAQVAYFSGCILKQLVIFRFFRLDNARAHSLRSYI